VLQAGGVKGQLAIKRGHARIQLACLHCLASAKQRPHEQWRALAPCNVTLGGFSGRTCALSSLISGWRGLISRDRWPRMNLHTREGGAQEAQFGAGRLSLFLLLPGVCRPRGPSFIIDVNGCNSSSRARHA